MRVSAPAHRAPSLDVVVHGAGIYGLCVAYGAARRGARVAVVDPRGVAGGASGSVVGALAPHTPERWNEFKEFQLEALLLAASFWSEVAATSGLDPGYARDGRLLPIADERALALARERTESAQHLWRGAAQWQVVPTERWRGWAPASATDLLVEDTLAARLHPKRACEALAEAIVTRGGSICKTLEGTAKATIWACGWEGLVNLQDMNGRPAGSGVKGQAALLACDRSDHPQIFADSINIVPHCDGTIAVGSTSERDFQDATSTDARIDELLARAFAICPALKGHTILARWAGVRPRSRTRVPLLGPYPSRTGHFIANGGFKTGFGVAPLVGEVMADLVLDGLDRRPRSLCSEAVFDPERMA